MSPFSWLFGAKSSFPVKHPLAPPSEIVMEPSAFGTNFIEIRSRKFFGQCSRSPNNRYTLAWRDANHVGADPTSEFGRYLLTDGSTVVADGKMARPNDGHVADNGNFVLNDWGDRPILSGTLWAFQANGKRILSRTFTANLFNNGLSADGALAVSQTCNSNSTDSSLLTVFDLVKGAYSQVAHCYALVKTSTRGTAQGLPAAFPGRLNRN
jgi:hypothetical protein